MNPCVPSCRAAGGGGTFGRGEAPSRKPEDTWNQTSVAELSSSQIAVMTDAQLVCVIRTGRVPLAKIRAEFRDRTTLERLAYRARLCCRNRARSTPT